jgi:hypothetical protein
VLGSTSDTSAILSEFALTYAQSVTNPSGNERITLFRAFKYSISEVSNWHIDPPLPLLRE